MTAIIKLNVSLLKFSQSVKSTFWFCKACVIEIVKQQQLTCLIQLQEELQSVRPASGT